MAETSAAPRERELRNTTARRWAFTINNPTNDERTQLSSLPERARYLIWQLEAGENGTAHIQGYIAFKNSVKFPQVKRTVGERAHVEKALGNETENKGYCSKEPRLEGPFEFGTFTAGQGQRNDLREFAIACKTKRTAELIEEAPEMVLKYARGMNTIQCARKPPMREPLKIYVIWGPTGTGKTYTVYSLRPNLFRVIAPKSGNLWFDGYDGEKTLFIDEYMGELPLNYLLQLLDRYPMRVQIKGGHANVEWEEVFITSQYEPDAWYLSAQVGAESKAALARRITNIFHLVDRAQQLEIHSIINNFIPMDSLVPLPTPPSPFM